ncbi:PIG-L deacetylase family protein [Nakamurella lactea]|uniref:PIG-L deacetylase family protein n=1 Tax=Nakamurella lactea TaxID=459515 RepID=UPI000403C1EC|nr:PIG-L deacetylase family protein [Nakamurella lactea]
MTTSELSQLKPLPEDWDSALAVVAHPDDMEYGTAAAVARWTAQGKTVRYLLATRGEAGIDSMDPVTTATVRAAEQRAACQAVGVTDLEFLDHPDGTIHDVMRLRREIAAAIRRHRPDVVIGTSHREIFGPGIFNMADHRVVGLATLDAVRDAANRWVFTDLTGPDGAALPPWSGVKFTAVAGSGQPSHAVDVSDHLDAGVASLSAHRAYLEGLGPEAPDPAQMLRMFAGFAADRFGGIPCCAFEVIGLPFQMPGDSGDGEAATVDRTSDAVGRDQSQR